MSRGYPIIVCETLSARSNLIVIVSPVPNAASPSSGSAATAVRSSGGMCGSFPKSPTRPDPETTVVTSVAFPRTAPLSLRQSE